MIRALANDEIERVLRAEVVGRIGCHADGRTYVVPVSYIFENGAVYAHSRDGLKVQMMRRNPAVCFEVDHVEDLVNWHSVICWGTFTELEGADADRAMAMLQERLRERVPRQVEHGRLAAEESIGTSAPVVFRISLVEISGREERLYWGLLPIAEQVRRRGASAPADTWLSHIQAQQLAAMGAPLDIEDIWVAADRIAEEHPPDQVEASLVYQGVVPDTAHRIVGYLLDLHAPRHVKTM
jgi:nitroimidazol reductase NimA-like FMN-containing flavoprotein (pyridoxamine 5'-phosphate oxidase superfamily)